MIRIRKILYPTDFSPYSNQAYFHAVALAEKHNATLTILYVYVPGVSGLPTSRSNHSSNSSSDSARIAAETP